MKKAALFLTSLVSLSLLLSACQPEDKDLAGTPEVADKCPRCKIKGESQSKQQNRPNQTIGFFALSAIMVEKEVEAVQLVRLALGIDDGVASGFVSDRKRSSEGLVSFVSDSNSKNYDTELGPFKTSVKKAFSATLGEKSAVTIDAEKFSQSVDRRNVKNFVNWVENKYDVTLSESVANPNEMDLILKSSGTFVLGNTFGISVPVPFDLMVVMRLDRNSLSTGSIKVLKAENTFSFVNKGKTTTVKLSGENHEIVSNGKCYSLNGQSTILSDKAQKKIVYTDSSAEVPDSSFKTPAAACESRPTVDLSRAFVF